MAQTSKRKQALRRAKRQATLAGRVALFAARIPEIQQTVKSLQDDNTKLRVMLFAVLAQTGPAFVTQGTIQQVSEDFSRLSIKSTPREDDPTTFKVELIVAKPVETEKDASLVKTGESIFDEPATDAVQSGAEDIGRDVLQEGV